jgi:hypothetical protein
MQTSRRCRNGHWPHRGSALARAALGAVFAAALVCAATGAARAGDDDDNTAANQRMSSPKSLYDRMLQVIGLQGGSNIQYSERSPLVVPPTRDLPPPQADRAPAVADWPKDPNLTRMANSKPREKPGPNPNHAVMDALPLRPDQLNVPGSHAGTSNVGPRGVGADYPEQQVHQKRSVFSLFTNAFKKEEYGTFTGEPTRTTLTDPPPGYLTPSPDQPYGISPEQKKNKVPTVADRVTPSSGSQAGNGQ